MKQPLLFVSLICAYVNAFSTEQTIDLTVHCKNVDFANKSMAALAVNDMIPGPTLRFKQGDHVTINVHNQLTEPTAMHWHGIILPWQMDGVLGITQSGIRPGEAFQYQFTALQSGTYWYHAHAGLQEQQGIYGALIIDPLTPPSYHYTKDYVIVLSDWINTNPEQVLANLKKEGDYYSPRFPMQPSLARFIKDYRTADLKERKQLLADYKMMQQMRMSIYDIADVAYDALLLNGHNQANPWLGNVEIGDIVRLRFIGAGGSSIFHVKMPNTPMEMIHIQGNDVEPYIVSDFTIAPGETYDVLVKIQNESPAIIYAESLDQVGKVYGALVSKSHACINYQAIPAFAAPVPVTREMMTYGMMHHGNSGSHDMNHMASHQMSGHKMTEHKETSQIAKTKYRNVKALVATNDPNKPVDQTINMTLDGWMDRYIWFINGVPEHEAKPIILEENKRYRMVFKNTSMMHHPMHIHGHWFIVRSGHGAYDPLLHTIDMPPGATIIADVDTDASGQWLFHCHLLYHMMTGMSRVFQYSSLIELANCKTSPQNVVELSNYHNRPIVRVDELRPIAKAMVKHPMAHPHGFYYSNYINAGFDPFHNVQRFTFKGLYGPDYRKMELYINDAEIKKGRVENADLDIFYWHLIDQFWSVKAGVNYFYRPASTPYWQPGIGIEGLMPYFIETNARAYYHNGSFKFDLEFDRETQITNNFFLGCGIRSIIATKTLLDDEIGSGLNQMRYLLTPFYRIMPGMNVFIEYEHERDHGVLRHIKRKENESIIQNTVTLGIAILF